MLRTTSFGSSWIVLGLFVGAVGLAGWVGCGGSDFTAVDQPLDAAGPDVTGGSAGSGGVAGKGGSAGSTSQGGSAGTSGTGGISGSGGSSKDASDDKPDDVSVDPNDGDAPETPTDGETGPDGCAAGNKFCTDACVNINTDVNNCGDCGVKCSAANADSSCSNGACTFTCKASYGDCDLQDANGCEVHLTNLQNCGACGTSCSMQNGVASCTTGTCKLSSCNAGYADCDLESQNGCEVNLHTLDNCGTCGTKCQSDAGATMTCATGVCQIDTCPPGFAECDGLPATQCETAITTTDNCGSCGNKCQFPNAGALCTSGACVLGSCNASYGNCDSNPTNGCETSLSSNNMNCGACGNVCTFDHATGACSAGQCVIATCDTGWADCDGSKSNGCEVHIGVDPLNCGACTLACNLPHATAACASGTCVIGSCNSGWADCDGNASDGCERNIATDILNCGSCNYACPGYAHAQPVCQNGVCGLGACNSGWGNCDGNDPNGCEANLLTDPLHCGSCPNACKDPPHGTPGCGGGTCTLASCDTGWDDCDGDIDNGCEINLMLDALHCGSCSRACSTTPGVSARSCTTGLCTSMCKTSNLNCTTPASPAADNGCETLESAQQCGSCTNQCLSGFKCASSLCACDQMNPTSCGKGTCQNGGQCSCATPGPTVMCARGEICIDIGSGTGGAGGTGGSAGLGGMGGTGGTGSVYGKCHCPTAGAACMVGQTCCQAGCRNLAIDTNNCGACGRKCLDGFICADKGGGLGVCNCDGDADCNGGMPGTCVDGLCNCGTVKCTNGQRCLGDGSCG